MPSALWTALGLVVLAAILVGGVTLTSSGPRSTRATLQNNPYLDPGTPLSGRAPDFKLTDQFGRSVSLRSYRGKVVILAFNDSECTTICPLTIVLNAWGSWCGPCRAEFGLFATAAAEYGRRVAFLGADVNDDASDAKAFLTQHPVSYPSYPMSATKLTGIVPQGLLGTPSTIFINRAGRIAAVHTGQYDAQGTLDAEIQGNALGG